MSNKGNCAKHCRSLTAPSHRGSLALADCTKLPVRAWSSEQKSNSPVLLSRVYGSSSQKQTHCKTQLMKAEVSSPNQKCLANKAEGNNCCYKLPNKMEDCLCIWSTTFSKL